MSDAASFDNAILLKLSVQRALVGNVTANVMAVCCGIENKRIVIATYFSDKATDADKEDMLAAGGEVIADFPAGFELAERLLSFERDPFDSLDFVAFLRAEAHAQLAKRHVLA